MNSNKYKKLLSDTLLFSISNFGSKVLVFLLVPLYTNILSTEEYGTVDLIISMVNLLVPVMTLLIAEAGLRFAFDKNVDKNQVLTAGLLFSIISTAVLFFLKPAVNYLNGTISDYWYYLLVIYFLFATSSFLSNYIRGIDKTKLFALKGIVYTLSLVTTNILFLLVFKWGMKGYIYAFILTEVITVVFMLLGGKIINNFKPSFNITLYKQMLKYSIPMIPSTISWWIMNVSSKYIITEYLGLSQNGIYSVAYKIPSILSLLTNLFIQAWQISAIQNHEEKDNNNFIKNVYQYYFIISIALSSGLILFSKIMGYILYAKEYFIAWTIVPILIVAYNFSGMSGFLASVYSAEKKTGMLFYSTVFGAIANIVLNILLIPRFGIMTAAYSTLIGFFITWLIRIIHVQTLIKIELNYIKLIISLILLTVQSIVTSCQLKYMYIISIAIIIMQILVFWKELKSIIQTLKKNIFSLKRR